MDEDLKGVGVELGFLGVSQDARPFTSRSSLFRGHLGRASQNGGVDVCRLFKVDA